MAKVVALLSDQNQQGSLAQNICRVGTELLGVDGVSLAVIVKNTLQSTASSSELYAFLDEQQFAYGEGPSFDASLGQDPVAAHDFGSKKDFSTWPIFAPIAEKHAIQSMVAFPLRIGTSSLGVLSAYRKGSLEISADEVIDALNLSSLAASMMIQQLAGQAKPGIEDVWGDSSHDQSLLHLASGMVAEKLDVSIIEAMVRIRAHAYKSDLALLTVAAQIVQHKLNLEI